MLAKIVCGVAGCRRFFLRIWQFSPGAVSRVNEKSGVIAHADDRRLREGSLLYCICGENMVYQSVRVRCAGVCRTREWGQDKDMKEFTVTDKNGEKRVETLLMSSEEFRALAERENLPYSSALLGSL